MIKTKIIYFKEQINSVNEGVLYLSDNQEVINELIAMGAPVAAFEHDNISGLKCDFILQDLDEVDDQVFEEIYQRYKGIPWHITDTKRTRIRELSIEDLDSLFKLYDQPGITEYMEPLFPYNEEKEYQLKYIQYIYKLYGFGMWLVFDKISNELIGRAGIEVRESCQKANQAELGFCISPKLWGQGLGYEVCSAIIELAFNQYELESLIARCNKNNIKSQNLLKKLGFTFQYYIEDNDCLYLLEKGER